MILKSIILGYQELDKIQFAKTFLYLIFWDRFPHYRPCSLYQQNNRRQLRQKETRFADATGDVTFEH